MHINFLNESTLWFLLFLTLLFFYIGAKKKAPYLILISAFASVPFTLYLYLENNASQIVGIVPILLFVYSFILYKQKKHHK
jgi:predicted neutral ceramidase superfamily lipid hydrolase